jgi:hypothetical protein
VPQSAGESNRNGRARNAVRRSPCAAGSDNSQWDTSKQTSGRLSAVRSFLEFLHSQAGRQRTLGTVVCDRLQHHPCQPRTSVRGSGFSNPRERFILQRRGFSPGETSSPINAYVVGDLDDRRTQRASPNRIAWLSF